MTETLYLWTVVILLLGVIIFTTGHYLLVLWQWWGRR